MKIFVGIDIAKLNHFAAAISSDGEIILEPFKFTNDADGFQLLLSKLESFDKNSIIIGLESTAHCGDNLVRYLVTELYQVCVLNPIKTCQMRKNNVRKTKTDCCTSSPLHPCCTADQYRCSQPFLRRDTPIAVVHDSCQPQSMYAKDRYPERFPLRQSILM